VKKGNGLLLLKYSAASGRYARFLIFQCYNCYSNSLGLHLLADKKHTVNSKVDHMLTLAMTHCI